MVIELTDSEMTKVVGRFYSRLFYNKKEYLKIGEVSDRFGLIFSGMMKANSTDIVGKKTIRDLYFEPFNNIVANWDSFTNHSPSSKSIFSKGECIILSIIETNFYLLCNEISCFNLLAKICL